MGKFSRVLFVSDFDRTLTDLHGNVQQRNLAAIRQFIENGGKFTVGSGRSIPFFRKQAEIVPMNAPCLLYNGAACYDYASGALSQAQALPQRAKTVLHALRMRYPQVRFEVQSAHTHYAFGRNDKRDAILQNAGVPVVYPQGEIPEPWLKIAAYGGYDDPKTPESLSFWDELLAYASMLGGADFSVTRSMPHIVELWSASCNKGTAARALANRLGRDILVCIGDAPNDTAMLREADIAFCTGDCDPALRQMGFLPVCACQDGAVADAIAQLS
ncbi:MAG: Cof-type HAD-IIB family hydrolase [Oscillospiraceae bacterium]|jgi:HAD superfamily hydrolase (TIGR01484 family)|nr:Cof-type HAD-IIB family hydrolase [Oscillospiraceae bacterium]